MVKFVTPAAILIAVPLVALAAKQEFTRELAEVDVYARDIFEDATDLTARDLESLEEIIARDYELEERSPFLGALIGGIARAAKGISKVAKIGKKANSANNHYQNHRNGGRRGRRDLEDLYERDFDDEDLFERDLPQDVLEFAERDFDEDLMEREVDEDLLEREVDEEILERELDEDLMERDVDKDVLERDFDEDLLQREFDDLEEREVGIDELD